MGSTLHKARFFRYLGVLFLGLTLSLGTIGPATALAGDSAESFKPIFREGDRVAWIGSSSTRIGVWPQTVEFLLRTRYPELKLQFERFTTGGGTFATGLQHLDHWLEEFQPNVVIFNYGGNDAGKDRAGLPDFRENMKQAVAKVQDTGARVIICTHQASDERKAKPGAAARRTLYAQEMLRFGREQGWKVIDVHHSLDLLQRGNEKEDPSYTILKDTIHLTEPAYIAWGYYFFDRLPLPFAWSEAALSAEGEVLASENCEVSDIEANEDGLTFNRVDRILPILPPGPLPPRFSVPLEAQSRYVLQVEGLPSGRYEIRCQDQPIGTVDAERLASGVNLNSLLLDEDRPAPWSDLAEALWEGQQLDEIGQTRLRFEVRKQ